jgi:hypothetical protein
MLELVGTNLLPVYITARSSLDSLKKSTGEEVSLCFSDSCFNILSNARIFAYKNSETIKNVLLLDIVRLLYRWWLDRIEWICQRG